MLSRSRPVLPPLMFQQNGKYTYATVYKNVWDKSKRTVHRLPGHTKSVGKIEGGGREGVVIWNESFLTEHPELREFKTVRVRKGDTSGRGVYELEFHPTDITIPLETALNLRRLHAGCSLVLDSLFRGTSFYFALEKTFGRENIHLKLLSLGYFFYLEPASSLSSIFSYSITHRLPYASLISADSINSILDEIRPFVITRFMNTLSEYAWKHESGDMSGERICYIYLISLPNLSCAYAGISGDKRTHVVPARQFLVVVEKDTGMPLFYSDFLCNTSDVRGLCAVISARIRNEPHRNHILVADFRGFQPSALSMLLKRRINFIAAVSTGFSAVRKMIDENKSRLESHVNFIKHPSCTFVSINTMWKYVGAAADAEADAGRFQTRIYVHIYFDQRVRTAESEEIRMLRRARDARIKIGDGASDPHLDAFLFKIGENNTRLVNRDEERIYLSDSGILVLISDCESDAIECRRAYSERMRSQQDFSRAAHNTLDVSESPGYMESELFARFIGFGAGSMLRAKLNTSAPDDVDENAALGILNTFDQVIYENVGYYAEPNADQIKVMQCFGLDKPPAENILSDRALQSAETDSIEPKDESLRTNELLNVEEPSDEMTSGDDSDAEYEHAGKAPRRGIFDEPPQDVDTSFDEALMRMLQTGTDLEDE